MQSPKFGHTRYDERKMCSGDITQGNHYVNDVECILSED